MSKKYTFEQGLEIVKDIQKKKLEEDNCKEICKHCGGDVHIRNPKGFCDHLYYPENCEVCLNRKQSKECIFPCHSHDDDNNICSESHTHAPLEPCQKPVLEDAGKRTYEETLKTVKQIEKKLVKQEKQEWEEFMDNIMCYDYLDMPQKEYKFLKNKFLSTIRKALSQQKAEWIEKVKEELGNPDNYTDGGAFKPTRFLKKLLEGEKG